MNITLLILVVNLIILGTVFYIKNNLEPLKYLSLASALGLIFTGALLGLYKNSVISDTEFFGGYLTEARYYEAWDERVSCRHEIACSHTCSSTSGKKRRTYKCHSNDGHWHSYDVDDHHAYWNVLDSNGNSWNVESDEFNRLSVQWKNKVFVDLKRDYHSKDGDMYKTVYDNKPENLHATTVPHIYENKLPFSYSIYNKYTVSAQEMNTFGLYNYPEIQRYSQNNILSWYGVNPTDEQKIRYINAVYGRKYQIRVYVFIYKNKPMQAAFSQQALMQGFNKNELAICIGLDDNNTVSWSKVFSWMDSTGLHTDIETLLYDKPLNISSLSDFLYKEIPKQWKRKEFTPLNKNAKIIYPDWISYVSIVVDLLLIIGAYFIYEQNSNRRHRW